jgi:hypothetical protein
MIQKTPTRVFPYPGNEWLLASAVVQFLNPPDADPQKAYYNAANAVVIGSRLAEIGRKICPVCCGYGHNEWTVHSGCPTKPKL